MAKAEFSTVVESDTELVVDRTMTWDASGVRQPRRDQHRVAGETWYLAEGATHSGFNLFYLLQNPNAAEALVRVRYLSAVRHYQSRRPTR